MVNGIPAQTIELKEMMQVGYQMRRLFIIIIILLLSELAYVIPAHHTREASYENVTKMPPGSWICFFLFSLRAPNACEGGKHAWIPGLVAHHLGYQASPVDDLLLPAWYAVSLNEFIFKNKQNAAPARGLEDCDTFWCVSVWVWPP